MSQDITRRLQPGKIMDMIAKTPARPVVDIANLSATKAATGSWR
jgi:hypothetical protein